MLTSALAPKPIEPTLRFCDCRPRSETVCIDTRSVTVYWDTWVPIAPSFSWTGYEPHNYMHCLPLTCHQLYEETHLLVYRYGTFEVYRPDWFTELLDNRADVKNAITQVQMDEQLLECIASGLWNLSADDPVSNSSV